MVSGASWILWFTLVALILLLTPTGRHCHRAGAPWRGSRSASAIVAFLLAIPSSKSLDPPYERRPQPHARRRDRSRGPTPVQTVVRLQRWGSCCVASGVSLRAAVPHGPRATSGGSCSGWSSRSRRCRCTSSLAFVSSYNGADIVTIAGHRRRSSPLIPIAAGMSVLRFRLYDVDRIVVDDGHLCCCPAVAGGGLRRRRVVRQPRGPQRRDASTAAPRLSARWPQRPCPPAARPSPGPGRPPLQPAGVRRAPR